MGRPTSRMMQLAVHAVRTAYLCERGAVKNDSALGGQTPAVCSHLPPPLSLPTPNQVLHKKKSLETASEQYSVKFNSLRRAVKRKLATAAARAAAATTPKPKPCGRMKQPCRSAAKSTPVAAAAATTTKKGESAKSSSGRGSAEKLPYKRTARQMAKVRFVKKEDYENEKAALKWATKEFAKEQKAAIVAGGAYAKRSSKTIAAEANAQYGTAISSRNVTRLVKAGVVGTSPPRPGRPRLHPTALTDSVHAQMQLRQLDGSGGMTSKEIMDSLQDAARTSGTPVGPKSGWLAKREYERR